MHIQKVKIRTIPEKVIELLARTKQGRALLPFALTNLLLGGMGHIYVARAKTKTTFLKLFRYI